MFSALGRADRTSTPIRPVGAFARAAFAASRSQEGLFSFEFPEKPGALMKFLEQLPSGDVAENDDSDSDKLPTIMEVEDPRLREETCLPRGHSPLPQLLKQE